MPNVSNGNGWRLPAYQIEQLLLKQLAEFLRDHGALLDALGPGQRSPDQVSVLLKHASTLAKLCDAGSPVKQLDVVSALVRRVSIASTQMTIEINREAFAVDILNRDGRSVPEVNLPAMQIQVPINVRFGVLCGLRSEVAPVPQPDIGAALFDHRHFKSKQARCCQDKGAGLASPL